LADKLLDMASLLSRRDAWRTQGRTVVFTNGCFDLLHPGHIHLLDGARRLGDVLVVGLNGDASVRRLKGPERPVQLLPERVSGLSLVDAVDAVVVFDEDTPERLLEALRPDVLAKGGDYRLDQVVGREFVESYGGRVEIVPLLVGYSTTRLVKGTVRKSGPPEP
jgi:D-beta-D-heptose 7-phosphate kinase/D-beta-D-heptose 1-phosphate adenosyltransferase